MAGGADLANKYELLAFTGLVIPGFVAMLAYSRLQPTSELKLKDAFLEAGAFGIVNLVLLWPALSWFAERVFSVGGVKEGIVLYLVGVLTILVAPVFWAVTIHKGLGILEKRGWILGRPKTAWDAFFLKKIPAKIIVHLKDGALIGGQFGAASYASLSPQSGHLYLEKVWKISETGVLQEPISDSLGVLLRPDDYVFIEMLEADPDRAGTSEIDANQENGDGQ